MRGALAGTVALGLSLPAAQDAGIRSRIRVDDVGPFIVAFELKAERREEFVWPHLTFPGAPYARVLLAVDEMPRVRPGGPTGPSVALTAADHLRINGGFPKPRADISRSPAASSEAAPEVFVVDLVAGRIRVSLVLPPDAVIDAQYRTLRITLFETRPHPPPNVPEKKPEWN